MEETANTPKQSIKSEHDFAQLGRQLLLKPGITTVALSGIVCFLNNKTPEYLENPPADEKSKMIERAIQEKSSLCAEYKNRRRMKVEKRLEQMREKKEKTEKHQITKARKKEELDKVIQQSGGLWRSEVELLQNKEVTDVNKWRGSLITQIKYRKVVLET